MKKEVDPKIFAVIIGVVVLVIVLLGWQVVSRPNANNLPPPPASTVPKPPAPPGTYFPPGSGRASNGPVAPDPTTPQALEQNMKQK